MKTNVDKQDNMDFLFIIKKSLLRQRKRCTARGVPGVTEYSNPPPQKNPVTSPDFTEKMDPQINEMQFFTGEK